MMANVESPKGQEEEEEERNYNLVWLTRQN